MDIVLLEPGDPAILSDDDAKQADSLIGEQWHDNNLKMGKCIALVSLHDGILQAITADKASITTTKNHPINQLTCVKYVDQTSVMLLEYCLCGKPIGEGKDQPTKIYILRTYGDKTTAIITLVLRDAMVSNIECQALPNDKPTEQLTLNFTEILWTYTMQTPVPK